MSGASWDFIWSVALREATGSKRLLGEDQGDRIESREPFCDGVLAAFVGRNLLFQVFHMGRELWRQMGMESRSGTQLAGRQRVPGLGQLILKLEDFPR